MTDPSHMQIALKAKAEDILRAWTDALPHWFAEHADVSIPDKRYDFWGRYTPGSPNRDEGRHPLLGYEADKSLKFGWRLNEQDMVVEVTVQPRGDEQIVVVQFTNHEDFWFLSLENLRRHLDGKAPVRCDFSRSMLGDIHHAIEIDAPPDRVFDILIQPEQLQRWIASQATVEPRVGGRYDLGWGSVASLRILELVPGEHLRLDWSDEQRQTILDWTLEESGGKTRLTLVHSGFTPDQDTGMVNGWLNFMSWIKSIAEYGADWKPSIMRVKPEMLSYYPASIGAAQAEVVTVSP